MWKTLKYGTLGLMALVIVSAALLGLGMLRVGGWRILGTATESARTDIYRENKSYVEGTIRDLRDMHVQYVQAEPGHKDALRSLILHRAGELDWDRLPRDVRGFLLDLRGDLR